MPGELRILGRGVRLCDGVRRRELMRVGGLSLFGGVNTAHLLRANEAQKAVAPGPAPVKPKPAARSVILFNLLGGPSHQDMVDLKPDAPAEIRGEFRPIATSLAGVQICEHLPRLARWMHRACLIRTLTHSYNAHNPLAMMTGFIGENSQVTSKNSDPPDIGAVCQYLGLGPRDLPGAVCMPCYPGWGEGIRRPGPYGGYLGGQYDPLFTACDPKFERKPKVAYYDPVMPIGAPYLPGLESAPDLTAIRFDHRKSLVQQVDRQTRLVEHSSAVTRMDRFQQRAFDLLSSGRTRAAFDLDKEPASVKARYGPSLSATSLLCARRLVEAGVPFVSVHAEIFGAMGHSYDMHENNFGMLRDFNLPILDRAVPALLEDLDARGLLDSTLVVVMGEMGRSPRVNSKAGREHWPQCGFSLLFGAGLKQGMVYGKTDKIAAYPIDNPVAPCDLVATLYHLLGIDPGLLVEDRLGRPIAVAHGGAAIRAILA